MATSTGTVKWFNETKGFNLWRRLQNFGRRPKGWVRS